MITKDSLEYLFNMTASLQSARVPGSGGVPYTFVPAGHQLQSLEHLMPPQRIKQMPHFIDAGSFSDYVNRFKDPATLIFAQVTPTGATLKALLDYHVPPGRPVDGLAEDGGFPKSDVQTPSAPRYCHHQAFLTLVETEDWKRWIAANRKAMTQVEFATWLEDNAALFNSVKDGALKGADLLELVATLHGKTDVRFNTMIRLKDGANRLNYEEDVGVQGQLRSESMDLPPIITAALQPFDGGPTYQVDARLKTRVEGRKLSLWFETVALHKIVRDAILDTVKEVTKATGIIPLLGTP